MTNPITDEHFHAFGRIAHIYANVEVGIKCCTGGMLDLTSYHAMAIAAPYQAYSVASVAKALAPECLTTERSKQFIVLVNRWFDYTALRTAVAHHRWHEGSRPKSIRPTFYEVKTGQLELKGFAEKERDYTARELLEIANKLYDLNVEVITFLKESGLDSIIRRNDAASMGKSDSSDGT